MLEALGIGALALAVVSVLFLVALVARRMSLARADRRRSELEARLRPLALALVDGGAVEERTLTEAERAILAESIARLSRSVTGDAREQIGEYFSGTEAYENEIRALGDRRAWRRATAAYRLGDMACPDAVPAILERVEDHDPDVRAAAARSLGRLAASEAAAPLVRTLVDGTVPRAIAFRALLDIGSGALPVLRDLVYHPDQNVRMSAVELLGWLGEASDDAILIDAVRDPAAEVRARAAGALGRLAAFEGAEALTGALDDRIYFVRLHAARGLGQVGEQAAVPRLLRQAREDRFEAARAAAEALARIDPDALLAAAEEPGAGPHLHEAADLLRV
jgi:HEAT repeat protein